MFQRQYEAADRQRYAPGTGKRVHALLYRHPVLLPLVLLGSSILTGIAGMNMDSLFPIFALINISSTYLCLSLACVLGIAGIVVSIIGILEHIDRSLPALMSSKE